MNTSDIVAFLIPLGTGVVPIAVVLIFSRKTRKQREAAWINWIKQVEIGRETFLEQVHLLQMARMRAEREKMKTLQEVW